MATETKRKFAVVTGASSGIGFELARQCVEHDFDVLICAEDSGIQRAAISLDGRGATVIPIQVDLSLYGGVEALYQAITEHHRAVDALLLNAGVGVGGAAGQRLEDARTGDGATSPRATPQIHRRSSF